MSYLPVNRLAPSYTPLDSAAVKLTVRQHPHHALVTHEHKEKGRKPLDPPPIVQMHVESSNDPNEHWLVNPFLFMMAMIVDAKTEQHIGGNLLIGQNVSSLHRLKDVDNKDGGFFVFGDISVRKTGMYKLQFNLYDYDKSSSHAILVDTIMSNEFKVVSTKDFKGLSESTHLSRHFSDQGVRLRLRKEPRANTGTKRAWNNTPPETSPESAHTGLYGGPVHAHQGYNVPPLKRQRSNDDYASSYLYPSYQVPRATNNYGASFSSDGSNSHATWAGTHDAKAYSSEATSNSLTGMMTPTHTNASSMWQRGLPLSAYGGAVGSTPVSAGGSANYFSNGLGSSGSSMGSRGAYHPHSAYTTPHHHQQQPATLSSQYPTPLRSSTSDTYPSLTGLHTPTSLSDHALGSSTNGPSGSGNAAANAAYMQTPQEVHASQAHSQSGHGSGAGATGHTPMAHFTGRGLTLEQPVGGLSDGAHQQPDYMF